MHCQLFIPNPIPFITAFHVHRYCSRTVTIKFPPNLPAMIWCQRLHLYLDLRKQGPDIVCQVPGLASAIAPLFRNQCQLYLLILSKRCKSKHCLAPGFIVCPPQVQEHHLSFKPPSSKHCVHLCEWSLVRHPAVHSLRYQQDALHPSQGDNPGGRQQQ